MLGRANWTRRSEIEELLVDGDDIINDDMDYEYGNEVKSDNQRDEFG